jgi:mono/diheme cytochrome c family protein
VLPSAVFAAQSSPSIPALKLKGNVARGKKVFITVASCESCHTLKNAHAYGTLGPNLDKLKPSFKLVATTVTLGRKANPKTGENMPAFSDVKGAQYAPFVLTSQQIANVAKYVSTVAGR